MNDKALNLEARPLETALAALQRTVRRVGGKGFAHRPESDVLGAGANAFEVKEGKGAGQRKKTARRKYPEHPALPVSDRTD